MSNYAKSLSQAMNRKKTSQSEAIPGREADMAKNNAGGFSFTITPWDQLDRFLILGTEGGTYYANEKKITKENALNVIELINSDGVKVVERVVEISTSGRAPKNDPALFVLALAASAEDEKTRKAALEALPKVARIGTHLFHFADFVDGMRGWGRALRRAVANWYLDMPIKDLANQAIKYQQRDGWSHRDMLRLAHVKTEDAEREAILRWMAGGMDAVEGSDYVYGKGENRITIAREDVSDRLHYQITAFEAAKKATSASEIINLIHTAGLPREAIPTRFLTEKSVWEALLVKMPMTAMIRNLATMSRVGLISTFSKAEKDIVARLSDSDAIRKARVHPIQILSALMTYESGRGVRGNSTWDPSRKVIDALNDAFYGSFGNVTPTGKNHLLALDVSGSMTYGTIGGVPGLTPRVASAAMALVTANVESNYEMVGFTGGSSSYYSRNVGLDGITVLKISPKMRLDDVCKYLDQFPYGPTDCALPMVWAKANNVPSEAFSIYTDNETWHGNIHPSQALKQYRDAMGIPAKLAVVGMTATNFSIADPKDSGMMDLVGFDTATPQLMSDFFSK